MPLTARVGSTVRTGDTFGYLFDFGDQWMHECVVEGREDPPNPQQGRPVITWGWGSLPDQYGRRWADDDGSSEPPPRDGAGVTAHDQRQPEPIDLRALRIAMHAADPVQLVDVITGVDLDDVLQQVGSGLLRTQLGTSPRDRHVLAPYLLSLVNRLEEREWIGDHELAELMLAVLQRGAVPGAVPVDLDELISDKSVEDEEPGVYVNTKTGETAPTFATDSAIVGEDAVVDVESDDWILLDEDDSRDRWQDLAAFAASQQPEFRALLEQTIQGTGAFSRFRQAVHRAEMNGRWTAFSDDRRIGRARAALARHGVQAI